MTTTAIQEEEEEEVPPIDGRRNEEAIVPPKIELLDASEGFQTSSAGFCNLFNILSRGVARISVSGSWSYLEKKQSSDISLTIKTDQEDYFLIRIYISID